MLQWERRIFGRRKGHKLSPQQQRLLEVSLPDYLLDPFSPAPQALSDVFSEPLSTLWLEIGFGAGEHLIWQTKAHPDIGLIGCEPFINGVAKLVGEIEQAELTNIRIYNDDVRHFLDWCPQAQLSRVFILFPDPWPKRRHHKRRLISVETLDQLSRVMKSGAELRIASDIDDYIYNILLDIQVQADFEWCDEGPSDWRARDSDWPETRYERKAHREGRAPIFLRFKKI